MDSVDLAEQESRERITTLMLLAKNIEEIRILDEIDATILLATVPSVGPLLH